MFLRISDWRLATTYILSDLVTRQQFTEEVNNAKDKSDYSDTDLDSMLDVG